MRLCTGAVLFVFAALSMRGQAPQFEPPTGPTSGGCTLIIHVNGARNEKGGMGGALFNSEVGWPEDRSKALARGTFPITGKTATLKFEHIPEGQYGLVVLHDENMNHKMDRNFIRIPKEGFAFANNPHVLLTAPKLKDALVKVGCPVTETEVRLTYK